MLISEELSASRDSFLDCIVSMSRGELLNVELHPSDPVSNLDMNVVASDDAPEIAIVNCCFNLNQFFCEPEALLRLQQKIEGNKLSLLENIFREWCVQEAERKALEDSITITDESTSDHTITLDDVLELFLGAADCIDNTPQKRLVAMSSSESAPEIPEVSVALRFPFLETINKIAATSLVDPRLDSLLRGLRHEFKQTKFYSRKKVTLVQLLYDWLYSRFISFQPSEHYLKATVLLQVVQSQKPAVRSIAELFPSVDEEAGAASAPASLPSERDLFQAIDNLLSCEESKILSAFGEASCLALHKALVPMQLYINEKSAQKTIGEKSKWKFLAFADLFSLLCHKREDDTYTTVLSKWRQAEILPGSGRTNQEVIEATDFGRSDASILVARLAVELDALDLQNVESCGTADVPAVESSLMHPESSGARAADNPQQENYSQVIEGLRSLGLQASWLAAITKSLRCFLCEANRESVAKGWQSLVYEWLYSPALEPFYLNIIWLIQIANEQAASSGQQPFPQRNFIVTYLEEQMKCAPQEYVSVQGSAGGFFGGAACVHLPVAMRGRKTIDVCLRPVEDYIKKKGYGAIKHGDRTILKVTAFARLLRLLRNKSEADSYCKILTEWQSERDSIGSGKTHRQIIDATTLARSDASDVLEALTDDLYFLEKGAYLDEVTISGQTVNLTGLKSTIERYKGNPEDQALVFALRRLLVLLLDGERPISSADTAAAPLSPHTPEKTASMAATSPSPERSVRKGGDVVAQRVADWKRETNPVGNPTTHSLLLKYKEGKGFFGGVRYTERSDKVELETMIEGLSLSAVGSPTPGLSSP